MPSKNPPAPDTRTCWSCHAPTTSEHFCPACGKIQPLPQSADYFSFFGLPRKLKLDPVNLEQRFHQLSWKLHPDNFVRASESERNLSLERSSQLNDAYRTLREPVSRVEYLLANSGTRKEGEHKQQAPPELLAEVFELNESLDELRAVREDAREQGGDESARAEITQRLREASADFEEKLSEVDAELAQVSAKWDETIDQLNDEASQRALMARMNEILNRRSYIRNLVRKVAEELAA